MLVVNPLCPHILAQCKPSRLFADRCNIRTCKMIGQLDKCINIYIIRDNHFFRVYLKYLVSRFLIRDWHKYKFIESARADKCGINDIRTISGADHHNTYELLKPVHFRKKLVHNTLSHLWFSHSGAAYWGKRIQFIKENDRRRYLPCTHKNLCNALFRFTVPF